MASRPDHAILQQAAHWYAQLQAPGADAETLAAWRDWRAQGEMQRQAWQYVERIGLRFAPLREEGEAALQTLDVVRRRGHSRRQALRTLSLCCGTALLGWASWRGTPLPALLSAWRADYRSATGEVRALRLDDGTRIWLNGASALNADYRTDARQLQLLAGEVLIDTARDGRPFYVTTAQGSLQALGTRFSVRLEAGGTRLNVYEGAVRVRPHAAAGAQVVQAGEQLLFSDGHPGTPQPASAHRQSWSRGVLLADDMPLAEFIEELQGHHAGHLGVAPEIAQLRVMGTFPLHDSDQALDMLASVLPVQVNRPLPWWTTLEPR